MSKALPSLRKNTLYILLLSLYSWYSMFSPFYSLYIFHILYILLSFFYFSLTNFLPLPPWGFGSSLEGRRTQPQRDQRPAETRCSARTQLQSPQSRTRKTTGLLLWKQNEHLQPFTKVVQGRSVWRVPSPVLFFVVSEGVPSKGQRSIGSKAPMGAHGSRWQQRGGLQRRCCCVPHWSGREPRSWRSSLQRPRRHRSNSVRSSGSNPLELSSSIHALRVRIVSLKSDWNSKKSKQLLLFFPFTSCSECDDDFWSP